MSVCLNGRNLPLRHEFGFWAASPTCYITLSTTTSTQPCIPPGSLRVPASAGVNAGMSPLPGGR